MKNIIETIFDQFSQNKISREDAINRIYSICREDILKDDKGFCMERNCSERATIDYNGCYYWVCESHYKKLSKEYN